MNIKRAKQEIKNTIRAYQLKNADGTYRIPLIRQRPVLLMGPPGVGKTQIMEQIAEECDLPLVSYTITHHTRQSAIGLPFIQQKEYGGKTYSVTEYTMSEIIASVYDRMEETGKQEGILFIDEINCVSETLAPTMLQFLQCKTFGNQKVPAGWVIVAAGNPPEYNKSVREFDIVTLDRVKKISVEADFPVWKEFAYEQKIHGAIISYLEIRQENFCRIETTVDGKRFVTPRGWQDLSEMLYVYEELGITIDQEVVGQYLQNARVAKDFAAYLDLYAKYRTDYQVDGILKGIWKPSAIEKLRYAQFDERLSVIGLLISRLGEIFSEVQTLDEQVTARYEELKRKKAEEGELDEQIRAAFQTSVEEREQRISEAAENLECAFDFCETAFGEGQELVVFVTELTVNRYSAWFIGENGCDRYYKYNKGLLFRERQKGILEEMDEVRDLMEGRKE